ncbi:hypothetical protein MMC09_000613 [Bachmanniomyces sp. S44760]|nr:hypothetical protein [Bachmanniomyces sp. S44760]
MSDSGSSITQNGEDRSGLTGESFAEMDPNVKKAMKDYLKGSGDRPSTEHPESDDSASDSEVKDSGPSEPSVSSDRAKQSMHEKMVELTKMSMELPMIADKAGDTYIFIDPPSRQPEQDELAYKYFSNRYKNPFCMQKSKFSALNSHFFEKAFSPTAQFRTLRRRGLVGKLPWHIKYVLDLTPPLEGDEAVYVTTELCCSDGVRNWSGAMKRWFVSKTLVGGADEFGSVAVTSKGRKLEYSPPPSVYMPPEYSPVRHRSCIERVLLAVDGLDPHLDSAPKLWTTFAVAKYFNITHSPLTDYIVRWLRAAPNHVFIEALPDVALKIADGLECHDLCRDAFAILVGEEALTNMCLHRTLHPLKIEHNSNVHGRKKDDIPEPYQSRIEYASKAFIERMVVIYKDLFGAEMKWVEELTEVQKLVPTESDSDDYRAAVEDFLHYLRSFVRSAVLQLLHSDRDHGNGTFYVGLGDELYPPESSQWQTWNRLNPRERIFTRLFWKAVNACDWQTGKRSLSIAEQAKYNCNGSRSNDAHIAVPTEKSIENIRKSQLDELVSKCRSIRNSGENTTYIDPQLDDTAPKKKHELAVTNLAENISPKKRRVTNLGNATVLQPSTAVFSFAESHQGEINDPTRHNSNADISNKTSLRNLPMRNISDKPEDGPSNKASGSSNISFVNGDNPAVSSFFSPNVTFKDVNNQKPLALRPAISSSQKRLRDGEVPPVDKDWDSQQDNVNGEAAPKRATQDLSAGQPSDEQGQTSKASTSTLSNWEVHEDSEFISLVTKLDKLSFMNLDNCFSEIQVHLRHVSDEILAFPDTRLRSEPIQLQLTPTLVSLQDSEWRYLPLWAGGNDDGSGGVYVDDLPLAETGFSTAGPNIHTGSGSSAPSDDFELLGSESDGSTYHTSTVVNDGYSNAEDGMDRRRVYDVDSIDSVWGEVMARKLDKTGSRDRAEEATMDSKSTWDAITTPMGSELDDCTVDDSIAGKGVNGPDKGKGKAVIPEEEEGEFDDDFLDSDEEYGYDDNEGLEPIDETNDRMKAMQVAEDKSTLSYVQTQEEKDALRP